MGPAELAEILAGLDFSTEDENLIIGLENADDAIVYQLNSEQALIQTVDFFTPIVDDPYLFGQISAANSLSDVYAMGGKPFLAMNIVCFPGDLDKNILHEIMQGGLDKAKEAGITISGGHTIEDEEPKYGLVVSGLAHPDDILTNSKAKEGDKLILTKPLGTGIITTAFKADMAEQSPQHPAIKSMLELNKKAALLLQNLSVSACTDITGFGLIGHLEEMLSASNKGCKLWLDKLPYFAEVPELSKAGLVPGGLYRNKDTFSSNVTSFSDVIPFQEDLLYDPQTSGGLLIAMSDSEAKKFVADYNNQKRQDQQPKAAIIGEVTANSGITLKKRESNN